MKVDYNIKVRSLYCVLIGLLVATFCSNVNAHDDGVIHHGSFVVPEAEEPTAFVVDDSEIKKPNQGPSKSAYAKQYHTSSSLYAPKAQKDGINYGREHQNSYKTKPSKTHSDEYNAKESYLKHRKDGLSNHRVFEEPEHVEHIDKTIGHGNGNLYETIEHSSPLKKPFYGPAPKMPSSYAAKEKIPLPQGMPGVGSFKVFGGVYSSPLSGYSASYGKSNSYNFGYNGPITYGASPYKAFDGFKGYGTYGYGPAKPDMYGPANYGGYGFGLGSYGGHGFGLANYGGYGFGHAYYAPYDFGFMGYEPIGYDHFRKGPMGYGPFIGNNGYYNGDYDNYYKMHLSYGPVERIELYGNKPKLGKNYQNWINFYGNQLKADKWNTYKF